MFDQVVPINLERHRHKKVRDTTDYKFAAGFHMAYVTLQEFARASAIYPLVFLEDSSTQGFRPVALMGLDAGDNLFVAANGAWSASYIPAMVRRYPFALSKGPEEGRWVVCVDEASSLLSDTEGAPLFDEQDQPTHVIDNVKRYLTELQQMDQLTEQFGQFLQAHKLLTPLNMRVNAGAQERHITGCFVVNEELLNSFSDAQFCEFRAKGYLPAIYAHLLSLPQIERLVQLSKGRTPVAVPAPSVAVDAQTVAPAKKRVRKPRASPAA
jgi:hypothetical protein